MDKEDIYHQIKKALSQIPDNFRVLEDQINIDLQMVYFRYSRLIKNKFDTDETLKEKDSLFSSEMPLHKKKILLTKLAGIDKVEAYRGIERYYKEGDTELKEWALLAYQESKMILENSLLDEKQVFISTGLGGKGSKLRYFVAFPKRKLNLFSATQKKVLRNEIELLFPKYNVELENLTFFDGFACIHTLVPIQCDFQEVFNALLSQCNIYGNFLDEDIIITNVRNLEEDEIRSYLQSKTDQPGTLINEK